MGGVIAAGDSQTAAAGARILAQGGNAVDAVVAAAFASFAAEPLLVNIGGGGIGIVYQPQGARPADSGAVAYDFFSTMPSKPLGPGADFREIVIDFGPAQQSFHIGRASVAVPGVVAGLCRMAQDRGRLPLAHLLQPAVDLARQGAMISPAQEYVADLLTDIFTDTPALAARFAPTGKMVGAGDRVFLPQLAATLEKLGRSGPDLFYTGAVAHAILADQQAHGGLITPADLANYQVRSLAPIAITYRDHTILLPPPSSGGGVLIAFALRLLDGLDLSGLVHSSGAHVRLLAEVMRHTNLARRDWETSTGPDGQRIRRFLAEDHVSDYRRRLLSALNGGETVADPAFANGSSDTTHISVVDDAGLIAAVTTSAGENAGFMVGDTGVCLNNMLGEIDLHPSGFHQLAAGARLATMMSPAIVLRDGAPILAVGSGGSSRIRSAILQVIVNVLDFHLHVDEAVNAPRIHFEHNALQAEGPIPAQTVDALRTWGYTVTHWPGRNMYFGGAHTVALEDDHSVAVGDPRRGDPWRWCPPPPRPTPSPFGLPPPPPSPPPPSPLPPPPPTLHTTPSLSPTPPNSPPSPSLLPNPHTLPSFITLYLSCSVFLLSTPLPTSVHHPPPSLPTRPPPPPSPPPPTLIPLTFRLLPPPPPPPPPPPLHPPSLPPTPPIKPP